MQISGMLSQLSLCKSVQAKYKQICGALNDDGSNPVHKIPLVVYQVKDRLQIDEVAFGGDDADKGDQADNEGGRGDVAGGLPRVGTARFTGWGRSASPAESATGAATAGEL